MSRSHPPTLLTIARRTIVDEALISPGERVLVAVSGGPDSMALLHVLARLRDRLVLFAHGVDHGLRAAASAELDVAEAFARTLGVPFARTRLTLTEGGNLQARARAARHEALDAAARAVNAKSVATAHHADDRAETVLLRMLRGAGPLGLAALPPRSEDGTRIRPLLRATREDIEKHVARHAVPFCHDPSNDNPRFLRTRVRRELLPLLRALSPNVVAHLTALADQLAATRGEAAHIYPLPRVTQNALAALKATRSRKARIELPGGLVATYDPTQIVQVVTAPPRTRRGQNDDTA